MLGTNSSILALDVGGRRIGIATANAVARIAHALKTIENNAEVMTVLEELIRKEEAAIVVVGLPRGLNGQETDQTREARSFAAELENRIGLPVHLQDEAVTSQQAEAELKRRGKPYAKGDIDSLAAVYILEDFLTENPEVRA